MHEILKPIQDDELLELSEMYKNSLDLDVPSYVHSFLETMKKWKLKGKYSLVTLWSPNNCWKEDGTFIALMQFGNYDLFMFTLDPECKNLRKGIGETKVIDWKNPTLIYNLHSSHYPHVLEAFRSIGLLANFNIIHDMYFLDKEKASNFDIEYPSDVCLKDLDTSAAPLIDSLYKCHTHRYADGDKMIHTLIDLNGGFGLFTKDTNELVAWVVRTCLGQIGFLQTVEGCQRKGYEEFLARVVSRKIAEEGFEPMTAVSQDDSASHILFRKLGFLPDGVCYFLEVNK